MTLFRDGKIVRDLGASIALLFGSGFTFLADQVFKRVAKFTSEFKQV